MSQVVTEPVARQSLLQKYDIPVDHLDFGYVKSCTKVKELEKIVRILRSKEEGYYPDLLKATEEKLQELDPSNRLLRTEGKLLTKDNLEPQYWKNIFDDIEKWSDECSQKERELLSSTDSELKSAADIFPPVRRPPPKKTMEKKECENGEKKKERIQSWDYKKWDKFDADAECLKMDLEETRRQDSQPPPLSNNKLDFFSELETIANQASSSIGHLSKSEKEALSNKEKELGNEFYKNKEYKQAARSYTKSIAILPTHFSYNNRAAAFLNMEHYDMAVSDANMVLQFEPENVKALYRRAQANEKLSEFSKALADLNSILKLEPNNSLAKTMKEKMKNKKSSGKSKSSAASSAKRSKLTLESTSDAKKSSKSGSSGAGSSGVSSLYGGRGEPVPGPSGVNTRNLTKQPVTPKRIATEIKPSGHGEREGSKKGLRKVEVLEVNREDDSCMFDWRRYLSEGCTSKIEVASKFREKASREPRPKESEVKVKSRSGSGSGSGSVPLSKSMSCIAETLPQSSPPRTTSTRSLYVDGSNFTQSWEILARERASLIDKANLLRTVRPHLLQAVIGNKLEEEMLSDFLLCLRNEFKLKTETPLVIEYLTCLAHLDRFNIIKTFLPAHIRQVIQELMDGTDAEQSLRKLYL